MAPHLPAQDEAPHVEVAGQWRERRPLRDAFALLARPVRAALAALAVVLLDRHLQPRLDEPEHPPVADAPREALQKLGVRNLAEVVGQVALDHLVVPRVQQAVDALHRVMGAALRPIGVLLRLQVRFEYRLQYQQRRCLRHPVPDAGNAQGSELAGLLLRDENLAHRLRCIAPLLQLPRQFPKPAPYAISTRCPRTSPRPPRQRRHCGVPASRLPRESPRATPCRPAHETAARVLPSLSHVTRSGVSGPSPTLVGSRQWSCLSPFPHRSRTRAPSLRRHYPASAVLRAHPPPRPARPAPHGGPVGACHATDRASRVATTPLFHACRRHYPGGTGRCARRSLPRRWQPSPRRRRVGFRITSFEACSAFTRVAARMVAEPPMATRSIEVLQTMSLPPSSAPIATGWSDSCRAGFAPAEEWRLSTAHHVAFVRFTILHRLVVPRSRRSGCSRRRIAAR